MLIGSDSCCEGSEAVALQATGTSEEVFGDRQVIPAS